MKRTRVKVCGVTRPEDARVASALGADAVGVVFATSPRQVTPSEAVAILHAAGPFVSRVGVFADQPLTFIREVVRAVGLDRVQLSGEEPSDLAAGVELPVVKAVHVGQAEDLIRYSSYPADWFLLDAPPVNGQMGGTGTAFAWHLADEIPWNRERVIVAGGLTAANVGEVVVRIRPGAVDVSSGVEVEPGIKETSKIEAFFTAVAAADAQLAGRQASRE